MKIAEFLLGSVALMIQFYAEKYRVDDFTKTLVELENDSNLPRPKTYDFIIVGGGTAGCLLAGRLSEKFNVVLLEAGGTPPPAADVPYFALDIARDPSINYFFDTVDMKYGGVAMLHTGKMLGGSASHNDLVHNRGSPKDYDNFAQILQDPSWEYENVVEYFKRTENFIGKQYGGVDNSKYYGTAGPIQIDSQDSPMLETWFEIGRELGIPPGDPNGFQQESFVPLNKPAKNGQRSTSYTEFIKPYETTRSNLTVIRYANVSEILLNANKEAYGVAYTRHGIPQITYASKEVIISAGAFSSPLLLLKSGIGPPETLTSAGIPVRIALPAVGQGLKEHPAVFLGPFHATAENASKLFLRVGDGDTEKLSDEFHRGQGFLTDLNEGPLAFKGSSRAVPGWPNIFIALHCVPILNDSAPLVVNFHVMLGRPQSRGSIGLNATAYKAGVRDDTLLAEIDFNFFEHPDDVEDLVEGVKFAFDIARSEVMTKSLNLSYLQEQSEGCAGYPSDEYWRCHIRQEVVAWIHMVGSVRMGPESGNENTSVLDTKFRVRGVKKLRVIDGSVMPDVPNANLNAPVMMVAEKGVDAILADWPTTKETTKDKN